ncbi:endonuclease III domain-containing protein [Larkinella humicola]|uniref:Endonuclease III n=1 Tax=Larkinella humicola TaxID=2607654 RepID=A0A5N1JJ44_9BACT|nr:endonuclease III [Larkinella humicola]KAA9356465.1 endonuclease III [Larkinella humicola]
MTTLDQSGKTRLVHELLNQQYGIQAIRGRLEPLHELIATVLSHRTTHANEVTAFRTMMERFGSWEAIRDAPVEELTAAIQTANYPEVKAPYIKQILSRIIAERGDANIDFLRDMTTEDAMAWLNALPGVGPKTSTLLLLFNFQKPVLPVDTHVHRVSQRLGLIGPKVSAEKAHAILLAYLPQDATVLFNFHRHFYWHGQRVCTWSYPKCPQCVLKTQCDYFQGENKRNTNRTYV